MKRKELYHEFVKAIEECIAELKNYDEAIAVNEAIINSADYSEAKKHDQWVAMQQARSDKDNRIGVALRAVDEMVGKFTHARQLRCALDGSMLNDADLKLLTCGLQLEERDLLAMLERNKDNDTMEQLIVRYAHENGMLKNVVVTSVARNNKELQEAQSLNYVAEVALRNYTDNNAQQRLYGVGSDVANLFDVEG